MPCCGMSGHARMSMCGLKHFCHAHRSDECGGEPESLDHLRLKNQSYQICKAEGWDAQPVRCVEALRPSPAPAARYAPASRDSYVTFTQKTVRISSYQDDAIRDAVETWADAVPALA